MIKFVIVISFVLDYLFSLFNPYLYGDISFATPILIVSLISVISTYVKYDRYLIVVVFIGLFYDLLYSDVLLLNTFVFFALGCFLRWFYRSFRYCFISFLISSFLVIVFYNLICFLVFNILFQGGFSIGDLLYRLSRVVVFNLLYSVLLYFVLENNSKRGRIVFNG